MQKSILLPEDQFLSLQRQLQQLKSLTGAAHSNALPHKNNKNAGAVSFESLPATNNFTGDYIRQRIDSELAKYLELAKTPLPPLPVTIHRSNKDEIPPLKRFRHENDEVGNEPPYRARKKRKKVKRTWKETIKTPTHSSFFPGWSPSQPTSRTPPVSKTPTEKGGFVYSWKPLSFPSARVTPSRITSGKFPYTPSASTSASKQWLKF